MRHYVKRFFGACVLGLVGCGEPIAEEVPPCSSNMDCPAEQVCRQDTGQCSVLNDGEVYGSFRCTIGHGPPWETTGSIEARLGATRASFTRGVACSIGATTGEIWISFFTMILPNSSYSGLWANLGRPLASTGSFRAPLGPRNAGLRYGDRFGTVPLRGADTGVAVVAGDFVVGGGVEGTIGMTLVGLCGESERGFEKICPSGFRCDLRYYREFDTSSATGLGQCVKPVANGICEHHAECPSDSECVAGNCVTGCVVEATLSTSTCAAGLSCVAFGGGRGACLRAARRGGACVSSALRDYQAGPFCSAEDECVAGVCVESCELKPCSRGSTCVTTEEGLKICEPS